MRVLLLGGGGREHALAWKISQSKHVESLFIAPGNAGTANVGTNLYIDILNFDEVKQVVITNNIQMVIVGPEEPLVRGIYDFFKEDEILRHTSLIGPSKQGALLEGSKEFAKQFMIRNGIPTAGYISVTLETINKGIEFISKTQAPYVLKADGLAAGKGVIILQDKNEAIKELQEMLAGKFGQASKIVVIEQFLRGIEMSVFVLTDGKEFILLPEAKDYKRVGEGDTGPNTGGMGAVSPVPFATPELKEKILEKIIKPTIKGLAREGIDYKGFIFFGLMIQDGEPYVIEYNCRMGDPETEVVIPRLKNDLVELFQAVVNNSLAKHHAEIDARVCTGVVLVSQGYPGNFEKLKPITGLDVKTESLLFHAGTKMVDGKVVTNGGRVMVVSSYGKTISEALKGSYSVIESIQFTTKAFRKDIGLDLLSYDKTI
ncbi:MAG: phosphoribosylamine--glycine ligase [Bacteroidales bacterium]